LRAPWWTSRAESGLSSLHVLFPAPGDAQALRACGLAERTGVQFHWHNAGYRDFEDFLGALSHDKRQEDPPGEEACRRRRRRAAPRDRAATRAKRTGTSSTAATARPTASTARRPISRAKFFAELARRMPGHVLLVIAERDGKPIAAALDLFGPAALYGRYWGSVEYVPGLHFEVCYYQALEFCIERGIALFEGGAQGEHKHARGFLPEPTRSFHWLAHPTFSKGGRRLPRTRRRAPVGYT
jgi:predicted N-acyltransferase